MARLLCKGFLAIFLAATSAASSLQVAFNADYSQYSIMTNDTVWLKSAPFYMHANGNQYSLAKGNLQLQRVSHNSGVDATGAFNITTLAYNARDGVEFTCYVREYLRHLVFGQYYPSALQGTSVNDKDAVTAAFPAFSFATAPQTDASVGVLAFKVSHHRSTRYSRPLLIFMLRLTAARAT